MLVEELAHEKMVTAENVEDFYEILGVGAECALELRAGDVVSVFRSAGDVFTLFHGDKRCCWGTNGDSLWGDWEADGRGERLLYLDEPPESIGGMWHVNIDRGVWECSETGAEFSLNPIEAREEAELAGAVWAEDNLERGDYTQEKFSQIVANANDPCFPGFPYEELYNAAYDAAFEAANGEEE